MLVHGGFDSLIEEFLGIWQRVAAGGFDVVAFDGPGQGGARRLAGLPFEHDWEHPVAAVLDRFELERAGLVDGRLLGAPGGRSRAADRSGGVLAAGLRLAAAGARPPASDDQSDYPTAGFHALEHPGPHPPRPHPGRRGRPAAEPGVGQRIDGLGRGCKRPETGSCLPPLRHSSRVSKGA